jgi:hypothetical protein
VWVTVVLAASMGTGDATTVMQRVARRHSQAMKETIREVMVDEMTRSDDRGWTG